MKRISTISQILIILGLWCVLLISHSNAQTPPPKDSTKPIETPLIIRRPIIKKTVLPPKISVRTDHIKAYDQSPKIQLKNKKSISRKYYAQNIFIVERSDNPFALQKTKNFNKPSKQASVSTKELISDIFNLNTKTSLRNNPQKAPRWLFFIFLFIFVLVALLVSFFKQDIQKTFQAFSNATAAGQLYREQKNILTTQGISSYLLFGLTMGIFIFLMALNNIPLTGTGFFLIFSICIIGISTFYFLKHTLLSVLASIFPFQNELHFYSFIISNTNKVLGFGLIPMTLLLAYAPESLHFIFLSISIILIGLVYIYRGFRAIYSASDVILFYKFHFFIYLCTVEIAPILILLKLLAII